ncbi:MAG: transposase, partial [Solibacillus sp.]
QPPAKQFVHNEFPVLYKGNMFKRTADTTAFVKAFVKNDWVWVNVIFRPQDLHKRGVHEWKECNPKLVKQGKKYFLNFSYEGKVDLHKEEIQNQRICSVDLGLTNSAVCSIMDANGTVLARKFIRQKREKDQLRRATNYLRKAQSQTGYASMPRYWNRINGLQKQLLNDTASQIVAFAKEHAVHTIVFEFLDQMRVPKGYYGAKRLRFKLHYWTKKGVQNKVEEMAHYEGMRISRINPKNTSKLAFDGSGEMKRTKRGDLASFSNGKQYHADLSASYNIGARYFIREIQKTISEKEWSKLSAKVPTLTTRTKQTLASLITLQTVISFP